MFAVVISLAIFATVACSTETNYSIETENGEEWDLLSVESQKYEAEERVIELPKDSGKWFISVIGDSKDSQYRSILNKFDRDKQLKALKIQVHFWTVPTTSPAYKARYEKNTKVLPTIRVQKPDGEVVWEAAAKGIPLTAGGLYAAIKSSSIKAMALLPWRRNGTVLPWRNKMENDCDNNRCPTPQPIVEPLLLLDTPPAPLDDGGPPEFEDEEPSSWLKIVIAIASALAGGGYGLFSQWKKLAALE